MDEVLELSSTQVQHQIAYKSIARKHTHKNVTIHKYNLHRFRFIPIFYLQGRPKYFGL